MKKAACILVFLFCAIGLVSCHKPIGYGPPPPAREPLNFVFIGRDGKSLIHSAKDSLIIKDGITQIPIRAGIYKLQVSATDTTTVAQYGGFIFMDLDAFIANGSSYGRRNFDLYLNGVSEGRIYIDYNGYMSLPIPRSLSSLFTFNGFQVASGIITGVFYVNPQVLEPGYPYITTVYVLQL
jgi:hypothetical protein